MIPTELINLAAFLIFLFCVSIYSVVLVYGIRKPGTAKRGLLNVFYSQWVKRVLDKKETIIAVQTMRNLIMATTFLTSSMLVLLGLLIRIPSVGLDELIQLSATSTEIIAQYKLVLFVSVIIIAIIFFLLSLRQMVRFSILIGIPIQSIESVAPAHINTEKSNAEKAACLIDAEGLRRDVFLRAMNRFTFGIRAVFYGITIIFWFVSVYAFIIGTISLTAFLILYQDVRTPCPEEKLI